LVQKPVTNLHPMKANLLIVSVDEFPVHISHFLQKYGFSCFYSRGGLKTKEILKSQPIDTIIWLFLGYEKELAKDLLKIFNRSAEIPIVFITQSYDELDFAEDIKGLYANIDLNDDLDDLLKVIETASNQPVLEEQNAKPVDSEPPEIEFKNIVSELIKESPNDQKESAGQDNNPLQDLTLWNIVDEREKRTLSEPYKPPKKKLITKLKNLFE